MEEVLCPPSLKQKLQKIWEDGNSSYEVIRSVILSDVFEHEDGNVEGEPDETLYHTLYRFLFLFGIPKEKNNWTDGCRVWKAITSCLQSKANKRPKRKVNQTKLHRELVHGGWYSVWYLLVNSICTVSFPPYPVNMKSAFPHSAIPF